MMDALQGRKRAAATLVALAVLALLAVPGGSFLYELGGGESCARCHEIAPNFESWKLSTHKDVACTECHGDALTLDPGFHFGNIRRLATHLSDQIPEYIRLRHSDVKPMVEGCKSCHEQEFRHWTAGAHSTSYATIFLDPAHNNKRLPMDDCLRCHGMHFPGGIEDLVSPVANQGPWKLNVALNDDPAIPCLSCHTMHIDASDAPGGFWRIAASAGEKPTKLRPSLALYDRRSQRHISAKLLPIPAMQDAGTPVRVAATPHDALCYQCHAPYANLQVGSNDDKTPRGPYEGMACLDCHEKHTLKASTPCAGFHEDPVRCVDLIPVPAASPSPQTARR